MGLLDRVKAGVKAGAEQAAVKAREEIEDLQTKREMGQAYGDLGRKTLELVERGELTHSELGPLLDRIRSLKSKLDAPGDGGTAGSTS